MTALKKQWQELRSQRQQELADRQQTVRDALASFQQERYAIASQLRDDLSLFKTGLQQETQTFLASSQQQRQANAQQTAAMLRDFAQALQLETSEFLRLATADRSLMAQQLTQELSAFHSQLSNSVAALRHALQVKLLEIQADVQSLQAETQLTLKINQEERLRKRELLIQDLVNFTDALRSTVHTYLGELESVRHDRAQQLRASLQSDRDQRAATMDALFNDLSEFRGELRQFCSDLRANVWGGGTSSSTPAKPASAKTPAAVKPMPAKAQPSVKPEPVKPKLASIPKPVAKPEPEIAAPAPVAASPVATSVSAPVSSPVAEPEVAAPEVAAAPAVVTVVDKSDEASASAKSALRDAMQLEQEIYTHIYQVKGARLTEIETALNINRFQAVDALRSLIKKGLITQRDRIYLIQEEVSL
ncbi:MAG TPA: hypothetical protein V6C88_08010 [Chroococcidiopsis sp.]